MEKMSCMIRGQPRQIAPPMPPVECGLMVEQLKARLDLVTSNFTQTTQRMKMEREEIVKEKETLALDGIRLRRDKSTLEKEIELLRQLPKEEFFKFSGDVSRVTKALLQKIESLFPRHIAFQLSCPKQREHLEQIHTNCTSLSREVEDRLQHYLNSVGDQVSDMQMENSHLKAENWRLSEDYRWCSQNRSGMIEQHKRSMEELQQKHDRDKEKLLMDKMKLIGEIDVLRNSVKYKVTEVDHLKGQLKQLNMTCMMKTGPVVQPGGLGLRPGTPNQNVWSVPGGGGSSSSSSNSLGPGSTGLGGSGPSFGSGSAFNKPASSGMGSSGSPFQSPGSSSSLSNPGSGFNKPGTAGGGLTSSSFTSSSNTGSGLNKPGLPGGGSPSSSFVSPGSSSSLGNSGSGLSKQGSSGGTLSNPLGSGLGSSGINKPPDSRRSAMSTGSTGSAPNLGSSDTASNKPTSSVKSSSGFSFGSAGSSGSSTSSGSSGSVNSPFSWLGLGSSSSGQSKTGSVPGKTSTGTGGTGSLLGGGRTSGSAGGPGSVNQHIQELQRLINPPGPQEKQDLSRMLG